jgi:ring-1,2-phenylacetyl-CoA epoxidase subunit PaaE
MAAPSRPGRTRTSPPARCSKRCRRWAISTPLDPARDRHYLGFAGGSGITPVLSILKTVLAREPKSRFTLVYANRQISSIMFREELEDLKNTHLGRLSVLHVLETEGQEIDLFTGRSTPRR